MDDDPKDGGRRKTNTEAKVFPPKPATSTHYNIYVENSGSMKGYFFKNSDASSLLKDYYDRLDESKNANDQISFAFVNTKIDSFDISKGAWWTDIYNHCNVYYSPIDSVLNQVLKCTNTSNVSLVFSDFCFTSPDGNLQTAQSGITNIFTKAMKSFGEDFAISILKYDLQFDGIYYPTEVKCVGMRPMYVWILGPADKVKYVSELQIKASKTSAYFSMQKMMEIKPIVQPKGNARMTNEDSTIINVGCWNSDIHTNKYVVDIDVDLSKVVMPSKSLLKASNYKIEPKDYRIAGIRKNKDTNTYTLTVETNHPSPTTLCISCPLVLPSWIQMSNFTEMTIPPADKTLGIKSLIEGVYDAFANSQDRRFEITIPLN